MKSNLFKKELSLALVVIGLSLMFIFGPSINSPTGFVSFSNDSVDDGVVFNQSSFNLTCYPLSNENLTNLSIYIYNYTSDFLFSNTTYSATANSSYKFPVYLPNGSYYYSCMACDNSSCNSSNNFSFSVNIPEVIPNVTPEVNVSNPYVLLNLTFDDQNDPWKDYSSLDHSFTANGVVSYTDGGDCKWYGCADMTANGGDYLDSLIEFDPQENFSITFWVYPVVEPSSSSSQWYFLIDGDSSISLEEAQYGLNPNWEAESGRVGSAVGSSQTTSADEWSFYFISYDGSYMVIWKNDELVYNSSFSKGELLSTTGDEIRIGQGLYGIDFEGYLDELVIYSAANFTTEQVNEFYNAKKLGTPPQIDLYVSNITYELPFDWSSDTNALDFSQDLSVNITIKNQGYDSTGTFDTRLILDGSSVCQDSFSLSSDSSNTFTCVLSLDEGFYSGYVQVDFNNDVSEDLETNNEQRVYIPFLDRPFFHFSKSDWDDTLFSYSSNSQNTIAYDDYTWAKSFGCDAFSDSYSGNSVDPYGKKARSCALSCFANNYLEPDAPSKTQCQNAIEHVIGWANIDPTTYNNVQSIHELVHVAIAYDLIFPILTEEENANITAGFHDICQHITNLPNTRPDLDEDGVISGGNGWGFGSGMAGFCYSILGSYSQNPTLIQDIDQDYWGKNIVDEWMDRETAYLKGFKDDPYATYQEGWLYKFYSQFHLVENWWFEKKYGFDTTTDYQNALCSLGHDFALQTLDFNYNGNTLRNDESRLIRGISRGDSNSFEDPGSSSLVKYAIMTYYGLLCDDQDVKKQMLYLRNITNVNNDDGLAYFDAFLFPQLFNQVGYIPSEIDSISPKISFDNANDILTLRTNYTYINDTVIQIDGGEERGGGHSQAQGYFLYALGEPFLDYEQVPYEDDVRSEAWKNGISLQTTSQVIEGTQGTYSQACGNAPLNQYYGMSDCDMTGTYPDYRQFPLEYGGDVEDYIGTSDASFAGAYVWRPYKNADPVKEYFVKFGDVLVKRTIVSNNLEGDIYHNFINIYDEFSETRTGNNLTFTRNSKNLDIDVIDSNVALTLGGGDSGINYCFSKTSCSSNYRGAGTYRRTYLHSSSSDADFILAHHWYLTGQSFTLTPTGIIDKGVSYDNKNVIFDSNDDSQVSFDGIISDSWALVSSDDKLQIGSFNTTSITIDDQDLFSSDIPVSVFIDRSLDVISITLNSMSLSVGIDTPKEVTVTLDASYLTLNSNFVLKDEDGNALPIDSESGTSLTFTVTPGQNSNTYTIVGSSVANIDPIVTQVTPNSFFLSNSTSINFECYSRDNSLLTNVSIILNNTQTQSIVSTINPNNQSYTLTYQTTLDDGTYYWACFAIDDTAKSSTSSFRSFTINTSVEVVEETPAPEEVVVQETDNSVSGGSGGGSSGGLPPVRNVIDFSENTTSSSGKNSNDDGLETSLNSSSTNITDRLSSQLNGDDSLNSTKDPFLDYPDVVAGSQDEGLSNYLIVGGILVLLFGSIVSLYYFRNKLHK